MNMKTLYCILISAALILVVSFFSYSSEIQLYTIITGKLTGKPYKAKTLEGNETETLVVNLEEFDCLTFVETVTALVACRKTAIEDYSCFRKNLQKIRYRNGVINGYGSRLHYFSEWILQNGNGTFYTDITRDLGGIPIQRKFSFMSRNAKLYPKLEDPETLREIRTAEEKLSKHKYYYIPEKKIYKIENRIPEYSVIACISTKQNILVSHTGFAVRKNGKTCLLHASTLKGKVVISDMPLSDYILKSSNSIGIAVLSPNIH